MAESIYINSVLSGEGQPEGGGALTCCIFPLDLSLASSILKVLCNSSVKINLYYIFLGADTSLIYDNFLWKWCQLQWFIVLLQHIKMGCILCTCNTRTEETDDLIENTKIYCRTCQTYYYADEEEHFQQVDFLHTHDQYHDGLLSWTGFSLPPLLSLSSL